VISDRGADGTRFTDVSRASRVPVSTLQYYFGSREDLLIAAFRHECAREQAAMTNAVRACEDPWDQMIHLVRVGVADGDRPAPTWRTWVEFWRAALRDDELREEAYEVYHMWRDLVQEVLRAGITSGRFRSGLNPEIASHQVVALIDGIGIPLALGDPGLPAGTGAATEMVTDAVARLLGMPPRGEPSAD
jgi:AcrR family transcriptional regulator